MMWDVTLTFVLFALAISAWSSMKAVKDMEQDIRALMMFANSMRHRDLEQRRRGDIGRKEEE